MWFSWFLSDRGTSGIDIDLQRVDINQCPAQAARMGSTQDNIFADSHKCKNRTTKVKTSQSWISIDVRIYACTHLNARSKLWSRITQFNQQHSSSAKLIESDTLNNLFVAVLSNDKSLYCLCKAQGILKEEKCLTVMVGSNSGPPTYQLGTLTTCPTGYTNSYKQFILVYST